MTDHSNKPTHCCTTDSDCGVTCVPCVLQGVDSMAHYEQALRQVRYRNWRPATLSERRFRLTCSELNGRYTSNEFNLEVGVMFFFQAPFSLFISSPLSLHVLLFFWYLSHFSFSVFVINTMLSSNRPPMFPWCNGVCPASAAQRSSPLGTSGTRQSYGGPTSVHETRPSPAHDTHSQLAHVR